MNFKYHIFLIIFLLSQIFLIKAFSFDRAPDWDLEKRKLPKTEEEWIEWFYYADYRYPAYARRHFCKMGEDAVPKLLQLINEKNEIVRFYIINTLAEIKSPKTINIFLDCLKEKSPQIRAYAIETLMTYDEQYLTSTTLTLIRECLNDDNINVKISAIKAISNFGDESDIELLKTIQIGDISKEVSETFERNRKLAIKKLEIKLSNKAKIK